MSADDFVEEKEEMSRRDSGPRGGTGLTYFYDFISRVKEEYPPASYLLIAEEIEFARAVGPALAGLSRNPSGAYELIVHIGFGHEAVIELEYDRRGKLQPVMGGLI